VLRRPRLAFTIVALALAVLGTACYGPPPPDRVPVMGPSELTAEQMVWWFYAHKPPNGPDLTVTMQELAAYFVQEGRDENVRGDIAFAQSIVETGWFQYGGQVQWWQNNYGGLGAVDGGGQGASFPDARTGVRAQIQHLRAYSDPTVTASNLAHPLVDPRFDLVWPKGKAPTWNDMGNGNWATSPTYAQTVIGIYNDLRQWIGLPPV
jgi:hypothetical protein